MGILWIFIGFVFMEIFSWTIHKYIMHGPLWKIHQTHHVHTKGFFELNDVFTVFFGSIAVALILLGIDQLDYKFWIGVGISLYGISYFILHDVLIHKRFKWLGRPRSKFLKGIAKAHQAHHKTNTKNDAVSFGLFWVPLEYFRKKE